MSDSSYLTPLFVYINNLQTPIHSVTVYPNSNPYNAMINKQSIINRMDDVIWPPLLIM